MVNGVKKMGAEIQTYEQELMQVMKEHNLVGPDEETYMMSYLYNTRWSEC